MALWPSEFPFPCAGAMLEGLECSNPRVAGHGIPCSFSAQYCDGTWCAGRYGNKKSMGQFANWFGFEQYTAIFLFQNSIFVLFKVSSC
jgi:hypothetical protein